MADLDDAVIFSKLIPVVFEKPVRKKSFAGMLTRLVKSIGTHLSHNGVIIGHIKLVAELPDEQFLFLSLTRLEQVDMTASANWGAEGDEVTRTDLKINILIFGYSESYIAEVADAALQAFCQQNSG